MTIKRLILSLTLVLAVLLLSAVTAWLTVSDTLLLGLISKRIELVSGLHISYQSPASVTRSLSPELTVTNLIITSGDKRVQFHTRSLNVQINLAKLLFGQLDISHLWLGETRVESAHSNEVKTGSLGSGIFDLPITPVLHDLRIAQLSFDREGEESRLPTIAVDKLVIQPVAIPASLALSAHVEVAGTPLNINATLGMRKHGTNPRVPMAISVEGEGLNLSTQGTLDLSQPSPHIDAAVQGNVSGLKRFAMLTDEIDIPGEVTLSAHLVGRLDQLALEEVSANWQAPAASTAKLSGRIANVSTLAGFDLTLEAQLRKPSWLSPLLPNNVGQLESAEATARLSGDYPQLSVRAFNFKATDTHHLKLALAGQVDIAKGTDGLALQNMNLELTFAAPTTRAARILLFEKVPELGAVSGRTMIRSNQGDPALENLVVKTRDTKGIAVDLKGRIARFPLNANPNEGYALDVHMRASATSLMGDRLGMPLPLKGPLDVKFRIAGQTQALQLNQIVLSAGRKNALQVGARGRITFGPWARSDPLENIDLKLYADSTDTKSLGTLLGQPLPELGALSARAYVHTVSGQHRLDEFHLHTAKAAPLQVSLRGSVNKLVFMPKPAVEGIKLKLAATGDETTVLNKLFGLKQRIPAIGPVKANATISGSDRKLLVSNVSVSAGQHDILLIKAHGRMGSFSATNHWRPRHTDIRVDVASSDSHAFVKTLGYPFPAFGPLSGQAHIHDRNKLLALDSVKLWIGEDAAPALQLTGAIGDLLAFRMITANVTLDIDSQHLAKYANNPKLAELNPLKGKLVLSDAGDSLGIDSLHIETSHPHLNLQVDGQFTDFKNPATLTLRSHMGAKDAQYLGSLFDVNWEPSGPVQFDSQISKGTDGVDIKASLTAGKLAVETNLVALFNTSPPHIQGEINAEQFFFPDFLKNAHAGKKHPATAGPIFSTTPIDFSFLKIADVDLAVNIKSFDKKRSSLESAKMNITLKNGELSFNQAQLVYPVGKIDFDAGLSTKGKPKFHFKAYGQNLNPWRTLDMQQSSNQYEFNADVDIDLALTASGVSEHELASSLNGDIYLTTKNGKIRRSLLELVFVDLVGWTASKVSDDKYSLVSCGVADYSIHHGLINTNAFFMDTKNITITGDGHIDLGKEQIDYVLIPRKKSRLIINAEPVKIKGPLSNPSVQAIPWKSAAVTYGSLIFAPYIFVGMTAADFLFGEFGESAKESPCLKYEKAHQLRNRTPGP